MKQERKQKLLWLKKRFLQRMMRILRLPLWKQKALWKTEATDIEAEITDSFEPQNNEMVLEEEQESNISVTEQLIPNNPLLG